MKVYDLEIPEGRFVVTLNSFNGVARIVKIKPAYRKWPEREVVIYDCHKGQVIGPLGTVVVNRLYEKHPELKPGSWA
jgi:hypothetical protein